jgi:hypothetical protein
LDLRLVLLLEISHLGLVLLRRAERGLRIDPERTELKELRETTLNRAQPVADQRVEEELAFLSHILAQEITDPRIKRNSRKSLIGVVYWR